MPDEQKQIEQQAKKPNSLESAWAWLKGRKATIGTVAGVLLAWVQAKHWIDDATAMMLATLLSLWTGIAVWDKSRRGVL